MPITNAKAWKDYEEKNADPYGKACVDVAQQAMKILDEELGDFDTHKLICRADDEALSDSGGITGFMAGCIAQMISQCHSRGDEFRKKWNLDSQIQTEGEKANEGEGVLNPALLTVKG